MKKVNLTIASLAIIATMNGVNAEQVTTTTTESYKFTQEGDGSTITGSKKSIMTENIVDNEICKSLDAKIISFTDLDDDNVSFTVHDGVVILNGTVDNTGERDQTGIMAAAVPGVIRVDNLINVK